MGAAIGLAGTVHLANHRRGNVWLDLLAATGVAAIGVGAGAALHLPGATGWVIPLTMVGVTVAAEKGAEHCAGPGGNP